MPAAQRMGDANSSGGIAQVGVASVRVNGRPVAVQGNPVTPHPCCGRRGCPPSHCSATIVGFSATVRAAYLGISRAGDSDSCGHARAGGSSDVRVG